MIFIQNRTTIIIRAEFPDIFPLSIGISIRVRSFSVQHSYMCNQTITSCPVHSSFFFFLITLSCFSSFFLCFLLPSTPSSSSASSSTSTSFSYLIRSIVFSHFSLHSFCFYQSIRVLFFPWHYSFLFSHSVFLLYRNVQFTIQKARWSNKTGGSSGSGSGSNGGGCNSNTDGVSRVALRIFCLFILSCIFSLCHKLSTELQTVFSVNGNWMEREQKSTEKEYSHASTNETRIEVKQTKQWCCKQHIKRVRKKKARIEINNNRIRHQWKLILVAILKMRKTGSLAVSVCEIRCMSNEYGEECGTAVFVVVFVVAFDITVTTSLSRIESNENEVSCSLHEGEKRHHPFSTSHFSPFR